MRRDDFTRTEADAAAYERLRGRDEDMGYLPTAGHERLTADDLRDEDGPCRACYPPVPWNQPEDPWDDGPMHHPTRFDLPVSAEPPF